LAVGAVGLLSTTELHGIPALRRIIDPPVSVATGMPFELVGDAASDPSSNAMAAPVTRSASPSSASRDGALAGAAKTSPEGRLIAVYQRIGEGQLDQALALSGALANDMPSFRLAQAVHADLLLARIGVTPGLVAGKLPAEAQGAAAATPDGAASATEELTELRAEAVQRLKALQERPPADATPAEFVSLPKEIHHAIAVDTSRSRLYLFENLPQGMRLVADHYVSIGKQGVVKATEGDQRTPLGVYFVADRMGGGALEPQFGAGALELNYPNAFDRLQGRSGGGIYVHGVPQDTYSRPPLDSDGCVALANDELLALMNTIPVHDTPVIITRRLHWITDDAARTAQAQLLANVAQWQSIRSTSDDPGRVASFYAKQAAPKTLAGPPVPPPPSPTILVRGVRRPNPAAARWTPLAPMRFEDQSVLGWSDDGGTFVVTFRERIARIRGDAVVRQYWSRVGDQWKIAAETTARAEVPVPPVASTLVATSGRAAIAR
jgi:lipoprotein-anchoring transpeptidase ErfK/SrfK